MHIIDDDDNTDVNHNDTYIQNPNFPSAYDEDNDITYKVNKVSDGLFVTFLQIPNNFSSVRIFQTFASWGWTLNNLLPMLIKMGHVKILWKLQPKVELIHQLSVDH